MRFGDWLNEEYVKYKWDTHGGTLGEFSAWLGLSQPVVSRYINEPDMLPTVKTIRIIEKRLPSIHSLLFTAAPNVSPDLADRIRQAMMEAFEACERQNITPTSPEGIKLMDSILSKYGIHTRSKT